jgi:hypothetical protein
VDVKHPVALVDAVDGAFLDTSEVLQVNTRLRDDVGHWYSSYGQQAQRTGCCGAVFLMLEVAAAT